MILNSNILNEVVKMTLKEYSQVIEKFLENYLKNSHMDGYVLGISGGIDSSLVAAIAKKAVGDKLICVILPCESDEKDELDALELVKELKLRYLKIDLTNTYHKLVKEIETSSGIILDRGTKSNMKVRLRMVTLYSIAQNYHSLVLGTDNLDEKYLGYFTKYGDGAADLLPIVHLTKGEVREMARIYGLSERLVSRIPSAGLFEGQTDEGEMGVTYEDVDKFLLGEKIDEHALKTINRLHAMSEHKRNDIPSAPPFQRS